MLFTESIIKCEICGKEMKVFSGMEHWSIQDKWRILSLCKECSLEVKEMIEDLKMKKQDIRPTKKQVMKKVKKFFDIKNK